MKINGDEVTFSTGRRVYVNCGIVGLGPDLRVSAGYDNPWFDPSGEQYDEDDVQNPQSARYLTLAERTELADYMIQQWMRFKVLPEGAPQ